MTDKKTDSQQAPTAAPVSPASSCDAGAVKRRARAGLATIAVAIVVAALTLAGAAVTLLITGIVPLSGLEARISSAIAEKLGPDWQVDAGSAELGRIDGRSQLRVRQVSFRHRSGAAFRAPEAVLGYEPLALLRGEIRLVSVDLRGVNVRLGVNHDGALIVNADAAAPEAPPTPVLPDGDRWNAFTAVMGAVTTLAQGDGLLGALETAGMQGARLALVDPDGRQKAGMEDVDIRLSRSGERTSRLTLKGRTGSRWKEMAVDLSTDPDGTRHADIDIIRFEPAEAVALAFGTGGLSIEGLPVTGKASLRQKPGGERTFKARFDMRSGTVRFADGPIEPIMLDAAHVEMESGASLNELRIGSAELRAGATRLTGTGTLVQDQGIWRAAIEASGQIRGVDADKPVTVDALQGRLSIDNRASEMTIEAMSVRGPGIQAEMTGYVQQVGTSPTQRLAIKATDSDARAVLALWPRWTSPELHTSLSRKLVSGRIANIEVKLDLPAEDHARLLGGAGLPDASLAVAVDAAEVLFLPDPGLPRLVDARIVGSATGRTVNLAIPQATADLGGDRRLALSEGAFVLPEIWIERAPARTSFRSIGPMEALVALFAFPALKEFSSNAVDPAAIRGNSDLKTVVMLPMADDPKPGEVLVQSSGSLTGVASDMLLGTEKLDGGTMLVNFDRSGLIVKGEARIGGDRGQIEVRQNPKGQGEATLSLTLDNAARQKRGLGPEAGLSGPVQVKVVKPLGKSGDGPPRIEIDLAKASIDGLVPGLIKPAGRNGRISFTYVADPDGPDLEDFTLDAAPALIKGRIELSRQNVFESASLSQMRLSPGDNLKVEARRDGSVVKLVVRGAVADVRPFIRDAQTAPGPASRSDKAGAKGLDLDVDLDVPILTGFNSEAISNGSLKFSKRGGDMRSVAFQGRIGRADVTAKQGQANAPLTVQSENGGALMRFLDLYRRAYGGDLFLSIGPGDVRQSGELLFRNFVVRDEPALRRVTGDQPSAGAGDRAGGGTAPPINIDASEVAFTKLRAEFTRSASRLDVSDMVIWGQQVGFTLQGNVDYGRDRVDIGGTFVPGYAFNNAFAQVPVVGALLGGGSQYGGLFAVNFRISGTASAPTMTVNPLSALAPGILRRFVDPLGGAPVQRPVQPGQAPAAPTR